MGLKSRAIGYGPGLVNYYQAAPAGPKKIRPQFTRRRILLHEAATPGAKAV